MVSDKFHILSCVKQVWLKLFTDLAYLFESDPKSVTALFFFFSIYSSKYIVYYRN